MTKTITIVNGKVIISNGLSVKIYGGKGSGFRGHAGRPGEVGGSSSIGGSKAVSKEKEGSGKNKLGGAVSSGFSQADAEWKKNLSSKQKDAIQEYLADWETMRAADRKGQTYENLTHFTQAVKNAPLVDSPVYRGVTTRTDAEMKNFEAGSTFKLNAMSSFSGDSKIAEGFAADSAFSFKRPFIMMECKTPKTIRSIKGAGIGEFFESSSKTDKESIGMKGTKFRITRVEKSELYNKMRGTFVQGIKVIVEEVH